MAEARRGEIWWVDLDPTRGHEQAGRRPALVLSVDAFNHGPAGLVVVVPVSSKATATPASPVVSAAPRWPLMSSI